MTNSNKKNAPPAEDASSNSNCENCTACTCGKQATQPALFEMPKPETVGGGLVDWLDAHPGWWGREYLATVNECSLRELRLQSEKSGGRVIFSSSGGGLCHARHAAEIERRACAAELRRRAYSHLRRADEIEAYGAALEVVAK